MYHRDLRQRVVQFERENRISVESHVWHGDTFESHISRLSQIGTYARDTDIISSSAMLNVNIYLYQKLGDRWSWSKYAPEQLLGFDDEHVQPVNGIYLVNSNTDHFDVVTAVRSDTLTHTAHAWAWLKNVCQTVAEEKTKKRSHSQSEQLQKDRARKYLSRTNETAQKRNDRLQKDRLAKAASRANESGEKRTERLRRDRLTKVASKANETVRKRSLRLETNRLSQNASRTNEADEKRSERLRRERLNKGANRNKETCEQHRQRLETDRQNKVNVRQEESVDQLQMRLLCDRTAKAKKRKSESTSETQYRKIKRKQREKSNKDSAVTDDVLNSLQSEIQKKTHFLYLCVSDMRFHCLGNVVKVKFNSKEKGQINDEDCLPLQRRVKNERLRNMTFLTSDTRSFDGQWYICHACKRSIERGNVPSCNEKQYNFQVQDMPDDFKTEEMALNKLESHLLKLIIPFIRVVHIPRSSELKIVGPMICVEADIKHTMDTLLPVEQHLIPVCLKRRPEYKGHYIEEVVSVSKIFKYFEYFKMHNPLFKDVEFSEEKLNRILSENLERIAEQDEWKNSDAAVDELEQEVQHDMTSNDAQSIDDCHDIANMNENVIEHDDNDHPHNELAIDDDDNCKLADNDCDEQFFSELDLHDRNDISNEADTDDHIDLSYNYDLPQFQTEIHDDTVIEPLTVAESTHHISQIIANAVIEQEQYQRTLTRRLTMIEKIEVTPTASSNFKYWESAKDLEEKAFPHLFPSGTGGYLSTHQRNGVGFANYVKQRILGKDSRFRDDGVYMAFLFLVKEQIEIKRSVCTFFRKSKLNKMTYDVKFLKSADKSEIERTDLGYKVFKNVRGTAPYFQQAKLKVLTMIRQLGSPTLFLTLSAAEVHWNDLIRNLLQKERNCIVSDQDVLSLTKADVNKLISRNVTDVTIHFSNRMKIVYGGAQKTGHV